MIDIWRKRFILSDSDQFTTIEDIRPTETDYQVLDPNTFAAKAGSVNTGQNLISLFLF